jgi:hypothetical protein
MPFTSRTMLIAYCSRSSSAGSALSPMPALRLCRRVCTRAAVTSAPSGIRPRHRQALTWTSSTERWHP